MQTTAILMMIKPAIITVTMIRCEALARPAFIFHKTFVKELLSTPGSETKKLRQSWDSDVDKG